MLLRVIIFACLLVRQLVHAGVLRGAGLHVRSVSDLHQVRRVHAARQTAPAIGFLENTPTATAKSNSASDSVESLFSDLASSDKDDQVKGHKTASDKESSFNEEGTLEDAYIVAPGTNDASIVDKDGFSGSDEIVASGTNEASARDDLAWGNEEDAGEDSENDDTITDEEVYPGTDDASTEDGEALNFLQVARSTDQERNDDDGEVEYASQEASSFDGDTSQDVDTSSQSDVDAVDDEGDDSIPQSGADASEGIDTTTEEEAASKNEAEDADDMQVVSGCDDATTDCDTAADEELTIIDNATTDEDTSDNDDMDLEVVSGCDDETVDCESALAH